MKKIYLIIILLWGCVFWCFTEDTQVYLSTLQECYDYLDKNLSAEQKHKIIETNELTDEIWHEIWGVAEHIAISQELRKNMNPYYYNVVSGENYRPIMIEAYWHYLRNLPYDIDFEFEIDGRYYASGNAPAKMPEGVVLQGKGYRFRYTYSYKQRETTETILPYFEEKTNQYYMYSYHFGWFILSEKEYQEFENSYEKFNYYIENKEKFFLD